MLNTRLENAVSDDERFLANAAIRCLIRFKQEDETGFFKRASDLSEKAPKSALYALYLIWMEIASLEDGSSFSKQELIASYLGQIQRGHIDNQIPDNDVPDSPECPTGAISILYLVLNLNQPITLTDSSAIMQTLLNEKLQQGYNHAKNSQAMIAEYMNIRDIDLWDRDKFIHESKPAIKYYARFLNETEQGRKASGLPVLNDDVIDAIADATLDAWQPT